MDAESAFQAVMGALLEFQSAVSSRFDRVDAKLAEHDKRFEVINGRLSGLEFHVGSVDWRVGHVETRLEDIGVRVVSIEAGVGRIGTTVEQLQRRLPAF